VVRHLAALPEPCRGLFPELGVLVEHALRRGPGEGRLCPLLRQQQGGKVVYVMEPSDPPLTVIYPPNVRPDFTVLSDGSEIVRYRAPSAGAATTAPPRPHNSGAFRRSYLGLKVDAEERRVTRKDCGITVDLYSRQSLWRLFVVLYEGRDRRQETIAIIDKLASLNNNSVINQGTFYGHVHHLKKALAPLGITISSGGRYYRLEAIE
jgi:hypothetical protein